MLSVGKVYNHPEDGPIYIESGKYLSGGRLSNFWHWRAVNEDGTLGKENCGYGCLWDELTAKVIITVKINIT